MRDKINTVEKFEQSALYSKLALHKVETLNQYRLYKDPESAFLVALKVEEEHEIKAVKVLPLSSGITEQGHAAIAMVIMEFIYGVNASSDGILREGFANKLKSINGEDGVPVLGVDQFELSLCASPTKFPGIAVCSAGEAINWELDAEVMN